MVRPALVLAFSLVLAIGLRAQQPPLAFTVQPGGVVAANLPVSILQDASVRKQLRSGLTTTFLLVTRQRDTRIVSGARIEIRYDLWDEVYTVRLCDRCKPMKVKYQSEAFKLLTEVTDVPVASLAVMPYEDIYYLAMRVDLNPVSPETLTEVRRWLSQGTGGGLDRGGVFFGSFVSVFVNPKIAEADRVLRIRSQPFYRPAP